MSESHVDVTPTKPSWLILGGCGIIGRNFAKYLVDHELASYIRIVDKSHPVVCSMNPEHDILFKDKLVDYKQADLTKDDHIDRAIDQPFTYVLNVCGETRIGLPQSEYLIKCNIPAQKCSAKLLSFETKPLLFIQMSSAHVYDSNTSKTPSNESFKVKPWTLLASVSHEAEKSVMLAKDNGLNVCILRPSTVYGPSDVNGLMPKLCCAATYLHAKETMKLLWGKDLKTATVHIRDVVRAVAHVADEHELSKGRVFNLSDHSHTDQGKMNKILELIFRIKTDFAGSIMSNLAKELLYNNHLFVDGASICSLGKGFSYAHPEVTVDLVREMLVYAQTQGIFPRMPLNLE